MNCWIRVVVAIIYLFLASCAGMEPIKDTDRTFERVIETQGYSKEQIFSGTKIWIAENFRSAKAVIEYENKDTGTLIGSGIIPLPCNGLDCLGRGDWKVAFTMRVDIKDEKFRLTFSNLRITWPPSYDRTFGAQPAHDGPINRPGDLDAVKVVLLNYGDRILASFGKDKRKSDW